MKQEGGVVVDHKHAGQGAKSCVGVVGLEVKTAVSEDQGQKQMLVSN